MNTSLLIYTFPSLSANQQLSSFHPFVFRKLKADMVTFHRMILNTRPQKIIGIASVKRNSRFETKAVNIFNRTKKVQKDGRECYLLNYPTGGFKCIAISKHYTDSFCNWTMYKISEYAQPLGIRQQFIHICPVDQDDLYTYLKHQLTSNDD